MSVMNVHMVWTTGTKLLSQKILYKNKKTAHSQPEFTKAVVIAESDSMYVGGFVFVVVQYICRSVFVFFYS